MPSSPTIRATVDKLFSNKHPFLSNVMWLNYAEHPDEYSIWGNVMDTTEEKEVDLSIAELGLAPKKPENTPIAMDSIIQSHQKEFIVYTYALGVEVSLEALQDDKNKVLTDQAAALGYSFRQTVETLAAREWFNDAFATTTAMDGQPIYGTHTTAGGFTITNSFNVDLDVGGITTFLNYFSNLRSERGNRIRAKMRYLIVPPELEHVAYEITESVNRPDTDSNAVNSLRRHRLQVEVCHYMESDTNWFGWGDKSQHKAKWYWRIRPQRLRDDRFSTLGALFGMYMRAAVGVSDYRMLAGSQPS